MIIQNSVLVKVEDSDIVNGTFRFPKGIEKIGDHAFYDRSELTKINLPQGIKSIGNSAFYSCSSLTSVNLPQGITEIGDYAFYNCSSLTSVNLPQGIESIGNFAFYNCSGLTTVKLPERIKDIGNWAFYNCSGLTTVKLPAGIEKIEDYAFANCRKLTSVNNLKVKCFDGHPAILSSHHKLEDFTIFKGYNVEQLFSETKRYYFVAEKDEFCSHGETIEKAIEDLNYKIAQEKLAKEPIYLDTEMSIARYRAITGSCQLGVKNWMKENNVSDTDKLTVRELLPILERTDAYGLSKFKQCIKDS